MDKKLLDDLETSAKALKIIASRLQNGAEGIRKLSKLGPTALSASAPNILSELKQLEAEAQRQLKLFRDLLSKAASTKEE